MSTILTPSGKRRTSSNLRGLLDYARVSPVASVTTMRDPMLSVRGLLAVTYADGAVGNASFASFHIMIDWVRNRRSWRQADFRHLDGDMGYLSKPGLIGGPL
jgi:hypothetical protein